MPTHPRTEPWTLTRRGALLSAASLALGCDREAPEKSRPRKKSKKKKREEDQSAQKANRFSPEAFNEYLRPYLVGDVEAPERGSMKPYFDMVQMDLELAWEAWFDHPAPSIGPRGYFPNNKLSELRVSYLSGNRALARLKLSMAVDTLPVQPRAPLGPVFGPSSKIGQHEKSTVFRLSEGIFEDHRIVRSLGRSVVDDTPVVSLSLITPAAWKNVELRKCFLQKDLYLAVRG